MTLSPIPIGLKRQLPNQEDSPWSLDPNASTGLSSVPGKSYQTAILSPFDRESYFVQRYFQQDPPPGFGIKAIHVIHNNDLKKSFESALSPMEALASVFPPNWDTVEPKAVRKGAMERLGAMTREFTPFSHQGKLQAIGSGVHILPLWHGTASHIAEAISNTGFTYFGKNPDGGLASGATDDGFFGRGIYLTSSADYANKYVPSRERDRGTLLLCWAAFREPFPIVSDVAQSDPDHMPTDMKNIQGQVLFGSYNAHYIPVRSVSPNDPSNLIYYPCAAGEMPRYDEFVLKEAAQTLVRYRIELGVTLPHAFPTAQLMDISSPSQTPIYELYPNPEENPLIQDRLDNPGRPLTVEESASLLTQCIQYGAFRAKKAKDRDLLLLIGNTGAGKSTTANYFAGCTMQAKDPSEIGMSGISKVMVVVPPEKGGALAEVMPIGHTKTSKTFMPHIDTPPGDHPLTFCDCPGFLDNRGSEINIANAVNIRAAIQEAKSVKMVILINYFSLLADRGRGLKDVLKICTNLFGQPETLLENKYSILIGVTNTPLDLTLPALKKWLVEDSVPLMKELQDRLFFFDPLDRSLEGTGRWNRDNCLSQIQRLKPILSHHKIFNTVLTEEDENSLARISEEIGNNIEKALIAKNYPEAASQMRSLEGLGIIEHITLERLIRLQQARFQSHFYKFTQQFKLYCSLDKFAEARKLFTEIQHALFYFPKLTNFFNQEHLPEYYSSCFEKYEKTQQRELAIQKLLADAEARSERSETRIQEFIARLKEQEQASLTRYAEQEKSYQLHVQQLQMQIEKITLQFEEAKRDLEKERSEREEKIALKIEELTRSGLSDEAAKLTIVREQLSVEYDGKIRRAGGTFSQQIKEQEELKTQIEREIKEQEEKHLKELAAIQEQTAAQKKAMSLVKEAEKENLKRIAQEDALQYKKEGDILYQQNQYNDALKKYIESQSRLEMLSPKSVDVATCAYNIGLTHQKLNNFPSALESYQKASSIWESLSSRSLDIAESYQNMGQLYQLQKDYTKARECYQKSVTIETKFASDSQSIAATYYHLARTLQFLDQPLEALINYQASCAIREHLIPNSLDLAHTYHKIGSIYHSQERFSEALEQYKKCLAIEESFQPKSMAVATTCNDIGRVYAEQKQFQKALEQYQKSLKIKEDENPNSLVVSATCHNIGLIYHLQGQLPDAIKYFQRSLLIREKLSSNSLDLSASYQSLGSVFSSLGNTSEALKYTNESLSLCNRLAPNSLEHAVAHESARLVYYKLQQFSKAMEHQELCLKIRERLIPNTLILADTYFFRGELFLLFAQRELALGHSGSGSFLTYQEKLSEALLHYQKCLSIREAKNANSQELAACYVRIGNIYHAQGKESEAKTHYQKSFAIKYPLNAVNSRIFQDAKLTSLIQSAKNYYSSDRADKVIAVCELQILLERIAAGSIRSQDVLTNVESVLNKPNNPVFDSSIFRKSEVKSLFENAREYINVLVSGK